MRARKDKYSKTYVDLNLLADIDDSNPRMLSLVDGFIMFFVIVDTAHVVLHRLVWIPSFVLGRLVWWLEGTR